MPDSNEYVGRIVPPDEWYRISALVVDAAADPGAPWSNVPDPDLIDDALSTPEGDPIV